MGNVAISKSPPTSNKKDQDKGMGFRKDENKEGSQSQMP
jgi:hypothetical protein